jgi:hypothetical protein
LSPGNGSERPRFHGSGPRWQAPIAQLPFMAAGSELYSFCILLLVLHITTTAEALLGLFRLEGLKQPLSSFYHKYLTFSSLRFMMTNFGIDFSLNINVKVRLIYKPGYVIYRVANLTEEKFCLCISEFPTSV